MAAVVACHSTKAGEVAESQEVRNASRSILLADQGALTVLESSHAGANQLPVMYELSESGAIRHA